MARLKKVPNQPLVINEIAKPEFKGDKQRLIQIVEGTNEPVLAESIPYCFSDPNLESGICNPHLPLQEGEPCECVFAKSCLVAKLLAENISINAVKCAKKPYEQVLAEADELFEKQQSEHVDVSTEQLDRQHLRAHTTSISLQKPNNPFRKNSLCRLVLDILIRDWITLGDLKAAVLSLRKDAARIDSIIGKVTSLITQEANGYRILESFGKFKAFKKG